MSKKKIIFSIIVIILFAIFIMFFKQFIVVTPTSEKLAEEYIPEQEISDEDYRKTFVSLYFKDKDSGHIVEEGRLIDAKLLLENPYATIIQMLLIGPEAISYEKLIPEGTKLNKVELKGDILEISFSKEFDDFKNEQDKEKAIESIKNTVTAFSEVNDVRIFVEE